MHLLTVDLPTIWRDCRVSTTALVFTVNLSTLPTLPLEALFPFLSPFTKSITKVRRLVRIVEGLGRKGSQSDNLSREVDSKPTWRARRSTGAV